LWRLPVSTAALLRLRSPSARPDFNQQGNAILADLGYDWDTVIDLEVRNVVA
jgi:hypothetical protein